MVLLRGGLHLFAVSITVGVLDEKSMVLWGVQRGRSFL